MLKSGHIYYANYIIYYVLFQYLYKHKHLPEFERFSAIEPVNKIVAAMYRSRDMLPKWFSVFDELRSNIRLPSLLRQTRQCASARVSESNKHKQAPMVPFDPKKVDNLRTVRSILTESADVARMATSSVIPADRAHLLPSTMTVTSSQGTDSAVNNIPRGDVLLQCSPRSTVCHPVDVVSSTSVTHSNVLILTTGQLQQLGFNASILPVVVSCDDNQLDSSLLHCEKSGMPDSVSISLPSSVSSCDAPIPVEVSQLAATVVTTSPNLIGRAFASAVGISIDQLSSFGDVEPDDGKWDLPPAASIQVTAAAAAASVPTEVICGVSANNITNQVLEQSVTASVPNVDKPSSHSLSLVDSSATDPDSKDIFARCDVDVSTLDITMLNSSLSPSPPSQPCDHHINNDSTLATPKKMECSHDNENLTFASAKIPASDERTMLPHGTSSAVVTGGQYPVACQYSEVQISSVSCALSGSVVPSACTYTVGSRTTSTVSGSGYVSSVSSVPVSSPAHGLALLSSTSYHQLSDVSGVTNIRISNLISLPSSTPLPADPRAMSLPSSSLRRPKQIPMHHMRSPSKRVPSNQRPILPRSEQPISSGKSFSSFLSKPSSKKSPSKVRVKALPAIAPKAVIAKSYLSPVKQAAASITARAKRLQNSPSRSVWYTAPRLKTTESSSCSVRPTKLALNPSDVWILNDDDDEAASGEGEEQSTDVDSQLEDEVEEESSAASAGQSPSVYVQWLPLLYVFKHSDTTNLCGLLVLTRTAYESRGVSHTFFYENFISAAWEFSQKCEMLRCDNATLAMMSLNYGMSMHNLSALTH